MKKSQAVKQSKKEFYKIVAFIKIETEKREETFLKSEQEEAGRWKSQVQAWNSPDVIQGWECPYGRGRTSPAAEERVRKGAEDFIESRVKYHQELLEDKNMEWTPEEHYDVATDLTGDSSDLEIRVQELESYIKGIKPLIKKAKAYL